MGTAVVTRVPNPYFLFVNPMLRLHDDRLIDLGNYDDINDFIEEFEDVPLNMVGKARNADGLYPGRPFESLNELGARYLAFLAAPDDESITTYKP